MIAPLAAELIAVIGGRDVAVLLQDYDQLTLVPLPGRGLVTEAPMPIDGSLAGRAFLVEQPGTGSVRVSFLCWTARTGWVCWRSPQS